MIKFRAWDEADSLMYYNIEMGIKFDDGSEYTFGDFLNNMGYHNYKIMQYTGFKDKNNKEIYEGDIIDNGNKHTPSKGVVKFCEASFRVDSGEGGMFNLAMTGQMCNGKMEIIGNLYENPELLEVK